MLPPNRELKQLWEVCELITDGTHSTPKYTNTGIPFLSVKNITSGVIDFSDTKFISEEEHKQLIKRCYPEYRDILYTKVWTTWIAKVIDVKKEFSIFVSLALLKPKHKIIDIYFLEHILNSPLVYNQAQKRTRWVANKNLVLKDIKSIHIPLPPLPEQKKIVAKLDDITQSIQTSQSEIRSQLSALDELWESTLHEAFNHEEWEKKTIEKVFRIKSWKFLPTKSMNKTWDIDVYWGNGITWKHDNFNLEWNNIIIGRVWAQCWNVRLIQWRIRLTDNAFYISQYLKNVNKFYLTLFLSHINLGETSNSSAQPVISYKSIKQIQIPLPDLETQEKIVAHLDQVNEKITSLKTEYTAQLDHYDQLRASVLDQAFKGELV